MKHTLAFIAFIIINSIFSISLSTFITRWEFQNLCDHVYDPRLDIWPTNPIRQTSFNPSCVKAGDIIFVRDFPNFYKSLHKHIKNPYIILIHGECKDSFHEEYIEYLNDPNIIACFGIHPCAKTHPKFYPIPLGITQHPLIYEQKDFIAQHLKNVRKFPKVKLLYINFSKALIERKELYQYFVQCRSFCTVASRKEFYNYALEMGHHKFTLCPQGNGVDSYRTWEAILVGSIPIVKSSALNSLYEGLPVLIIQDWYEITPDFLHKKYKEIKSKNYSIEKVYINYWKGQIKTVKDEFLSKSK